MKVILSIKGMSCSACSSGLEKYLNKQDGVIDASVNLVLAQANIIYEDNLTIYDLERFVKGDKLTDWNKTLDEYILAKK